MTRRILPLLSCLLAIGPVAGCKARPAATLTLATTTSTQDSGLLDILVPLFREQTGVEVKVVAVGTGQALALGRRGDADVLLVHAPASEQKFMDEGYGSLRRPVMYNDFVLVGPPTDPAGVKGLRSVAEALRRLAASQTTFVSRGDESGTHQKERALWELAGIRPAGTWYLRAGAGMGAVLRMASQKRAYTLSDRGTFLAQQQQHDLAILCEGDPPLFNPYSVLVVNPAKHPHVRHDLARQFADFLTRPTTQSAIAAFGRDRGGQSLFVPGKP